jgi:hypothetical protein
MEQRQSSTDIRVLKSSEPALQLGRIGLRIAAQGFGESELRQLRQQRLRAGPLRLRFLNADPQKIGEPAAERDIAERYAQHRRQRAQQRARGAAVAGKIAANEAGGCAAPAGVQFEQASFRRGSPDRGERELKIAAEDVQIVMGKQEQVSGLDLDDVAFAGKTRQTRAVRQQMEEHDVVGVRQFGRRGVEPVLGGDAPGCGELGVDIDRPVQADG